MPFLNSQAQFEWESSRDARTSFFIDFRPRTNLSDLSIELILLISKVLPLDDVVCTSLCSTRLLSMLTKPIRKLAYTEDDKMRISERLERDLPGYFACDICIILHRLDGSESFGLSGPRKEKTSRLPCVRSGEYFRSFYALETHINFDHSLSRLSFLQVKLAMKRFYFGPSSGISTDSLYYTQVRDYAIPSLPHSKISTLFSIDASICPDPLRFYVRMQDIVTAERWDNFLERNCSPEYPLHAFSPCSHLKLISFIANWVKFYVDRKNHARANIPGGTFSSEGKCDKCYVDFHMKIMEWDSRPTVITTRWVNLGIGLTKYERLWIKQSWRGWKHYAFAARRLRGRNTSSPRLCFEATACQSFGELNPCNLLYLKDEQYKRKMKIQLMERARPFGQYRVIL